MHESLLLVVDYEKICRLCLHSTGVMSDIYENNSETTLKELIFCATGLEVLQGDGLPSKICHKCRYIVELSCELRTMAIRAHTLLTEAADNYHYVAEYLKDSVTNVDTPEISTKHANKNNFTKTQDLKLVLQNDGVITLVRPQEETLGTKIKQRGVKMNTCVSTERTRTAAPKHLTCQICLSSFPTKEQVRDHVETHYVDSNLTSYLLLRRPFECEACKDSSISKKQLILHHRRHLDVNPFVCKQLGCKFVGKNQDSLRHHMVVHGARSQVCESCGAAYRRRWELRQHRARAHNAAPQQCGACRPRRTLRNAVTYRAHLDMHRRKPIHVCGWRGCPKAYRSRAALAAHRRAHAGRRDHACPLCAAAAYTSQSLLNRHLRMHERARISKCDKCAATFEDYGAFYRHRVAEHGPWQPYRCTGCNQGYQSEAQLEKHVRQCELAIRMQAYADDAAASEQNGTGTTGDRVVVKGIQEVTNADMQLQLVTEAQLGQFKGQSVLFQPGNANDLSKESYVLQELPPDGLLYIEVDRDTDEATASSHVWRQI